MAPSMPKSGHVRDRIAAFEKQSNSDNAIIRARFVPDVKGVNRYKHFHTPVDTTVMLNRVTVNHLPSLLPGKMLLISPAEDGYQENGVEKGPRKSPRRERLPALNKVSPRTNHKHKEKDIVDYIEKHAKQAMSLQALDSTDTSVRIRPSSRRLNDHITMAQPERRTFAELGIRQNGVIINRNRPTKTTLEYLDAPPPPRSQSAREVVDTSSESDVPDTPGTSGRKSSTATKDMATQTIKPQHSTRSVEILEPIGPTDYEAEAPYGQFYKKEHQVLLTAINQALDSTIDRYSRVKTEQAIIHAAKKQARVWRDAKDFIATQLVPQSIHLANKSKSAHKTAAEIVANIKCYP